MFKYLIELLKGFFLEFKGAKARNVDLEVEKPQFLKREINWNVHVLESSVKARVLDLKDEKGQPVVREGCFRLKVETSTLTPPPVSPNAKDKPPLLEFPEVFQQVAIVEPSLHKVTALGTCTLSNPSLLPLWRKKVKRETRVEREKIERALRVLQEMIEKEELKGVTFSGYFKNVPNGTIKIAGNDLIVDIDGKNPEFRSLMVFRAFTKDGKTKNVLIFLD